MARKAENNMVNFVIYHYWARLVYSKEDNRKNILKTRFQTVRISFENKVLEYLLNDFSNITGEKTLLP